MPDQKSTLDQLYRNKYGDILAILLRYIGYEHFDAAEDAVQTAFQRALEKWPITGAPDNPGGWLYTVARNAFLETARRKKTEFSKLQGVLQQAAQDRAGAGSIDAIDNLPVLADDLTMMILLCCNPELSPKSQVCLTLKSACGFSVREIARVLGMQDESVKKMVTRAKEKVSADANVFQALDEQRVSIRFSLVLETLYAMFTEGYAAASGDTQLRRDVAENAIHLAGTFLRSQITPEFYRGDLYALLALMLFQFSRFDARVDASGMPVRLQEQDRSLWNRELIQAGFAALEDSRTAETLSKYHLEARIAAEHSTSPTFEVTNWGSILSLYEQLLVEKDTPEVHLSRIVALRYVKGWQIAMNALDRLEAQQISRGKISVARSFLLHAVRADLLESAGRRDDARAEWEKARDNAPTSADRSFIENKLNRSG